MAGKCINFFKKKKKKKKVAWNIEPGYDMKWKQDTYLCQGLNTGVNVPTGHLRDDEVDGGGSAVVNVIKMRRDWTHPENTHDTL